MTSLQQVVAVANNLVVLEKGPSMDAAFEDYLKTADLTQYEKSKSNSRDFYGLKNI